MRRAALLAALLYAAVAGAQPRPPPPVLVGIDALRADFGAKSGTDTVYFGSGSAILGVPAKAVLAAQAQWLLMHPEVAVRIEGYADSNDTRDHALAMGAKRAEEVRDFLELMGVPGEQLTAMSWGKERYGVGRSVTVLAQ
jgi:peptidoglycan-associated lipoprotein